MNAPIKWLSVTLTVAGFIPLVAGSDETKLGSRQPVADPVTLILAGGGTVFAGASMEPVRDSVILISGDSIVEVGPRESIDIDPTLGAQVVDVSGHWLIPGLMDLHTHPGSFPDAEQREMLETVLALGVTTIRSTSMTEHGGGPDLRARLASGELIGPRLWIAGPLIDAQGSQFAFAATVDSEERLREEIRNQARQGVDYIKLYTRLDRSLVAAAIAEAHSLDLKVLGHLGRTGWMEAAELGIDGLTHSGVMGPTWELLADGEQAGFREVFAPGSDMGDDLFVRWVATLPPEQGKLEKLATMLRENNVEVNPNLVLTWAITYGREQATCDVLETHLAPATDRELWGAGPRIRRLLRRNLRSWKSAYTPTRNSLSVTCTSRVC